MCIRAKLGRLLPRPVCGLPLCGADCQSASRHPPGAPPMKLALTDRKSTRLNSSHLGISYAVFCLEKNKAEELGFSARHLLYGKRRGLYRIIFDSREDELHVFFLMIRQPPRSTLFPSTALFQ